MQRSGCKDISSVIQIQPEVRTEIHPEYYRAVNTVADGKAKDLRLMLIFSSWLEWQRVLNNPEKKIQETETQTTKRETERSENSPSLQTEQKPNLQ